MKSWMEYAAAGALIGLFIILAGTSARHKSATVDEFAHLAVGCYALKTHDFSMFMKTPPSGRMLLTLPAYLMGPVIPPGEGPREDGWLPWGYGATFMYENWSRYHELLFAARGAVICVGALVCALVWLWSRRLYGKAGGLTSLTACALSPTLLAHSQVVTTDVIIALAVGGFIFVALAYAHRPTFLRSALIGLALGLAVLCKFTAPLFAPLALAAPVGAYFYSRRNSGTPRVRALAGQAALIVAVTWLAVAGGYFGHKVSFHRDLRLQSKALLAVKPVINLVPLPEEFIVGLDMQMVDAEQQEFSESNYIFGKYYTGRKWYYYPAAVAAKEPAQYLVVFLIAGTLVIRRRPRVFDELVLLGTVGAFVAATSLFNALQIGIRYLLVVYPLVFVLMGRVGRTVFQPREKGAAGRRERAFMGLLMGAGLWALIGAIGIWPDYLAYFSPAAGGPRNGYKILLDSNLDWGQDLPGLKRWMDENKISSIDLAYFGHEDPLMYDLHYNVPAAGSGNRFIAISASFLMGRKYPLSYSQEIITKTHPIWRELATYRDRKPVARIGYSIFIFDQGPGQ